MQGTPNRFSNVSLSHARHRGNHIAGHDPCSCCRGVVEYLCHDDAYVVGNPQPSGDLRRERLDLHAEIAPVNRALVDELIHDRLGCVAGNGESDALRAAALRLDRGVDADDSAFQVDKWAAAIARIDGGIRLQKVVERADAQSWNAIRSVDIKVT